MNNSIIFQTQKNIRIYDLVKQELFKKLMSYAKWISSMAIHPSILFFTLISLQVLFAITS